MKRKSELKCWAVRGLALCCLCALICLYGCKDDFQAPDLQTYNLKGHVKSVDINVYIFGENESTYCKEHLEFDKNGKRILDSDISVKRNSGGYIILIKDDLGGEEFEYDGNWRVISRKEWSTSTQTERFIKFDEDGNLIESEIYGEPDPENNNDKPFGKNVYEYIKTDRHGNWTLRSVERKETPYTPYGQDRGWMEERVIAYY